MAPCGATALKFAAVAGHHEIVEALIECGAVYGEGGHELRRRVTELRGRAPAAALKACVEAAARRAQGLSALPDMSDVAKHGFAGRGLTHLQLQMLSSQLRARHEASGSLVKFGDLATKQVVESHLKALTGRPECGCPGCASYMPVGASDPPPMCPGPHSPHCGTSGRFEPCRFFQCCRKHDQGPRTGYCRGCDGSGQSAADWCGGGPVPSQFFVSHSWNQRFEENLLSLRLFAVAVCSRHSADSLVLCTRCEGTSFWICALAINQHIPLSDQILGAEGSQATLKCIKSTRGIALVLDDMLQPFKRVWCLYELMVAVRDDFPLDVVTVAGAPTRRWSYDADLVRRIRCGIEGIRVDAAESFDPDDKVQILESVRRELPGGVLEMEHRIRERLLGSFQAAQAQADAIEAVRSGDVSSLRRAMRVRPTLTAHVDPETGQSLVKAAVLRGDAACVEAFLEAGAVLGADGVWSFQDTCIAPEGLEALTSGLCRAATALAPTHLILSKNAGLLKGQRGVEALAALLNLLPSLRELRVQASGLTAEGLAALSAAEFDMPLALTQLRMVCCSRA